MLTVKICGIQTIDAAQAAQDFGADLIGFVFAESRRKIGVSAAAKISAALTRVGKVGVFLNQPLTEVLEIAERCQLDLVQLHGDESPEYCQKLNRPVIKAFRLDSDFSPALVQAYNVPWILLDSFVPGQAGGTGVAFDWEAGRKRLGRPKQKVFVAGGLTPENVAEAIGLLQPDGVDVSGGVEDAGEKSRKKIGRFIAAAQAAVQLNPTTRRNRRVECDCQ
jgi:phosphoribosylanthranilate isomerase